MRQRIGVLAVVLLMAGGAFGRAAAGGGGAKPAPRPQKVYVAVFDFASSPPRLGQQLADSVRQMLARHEEFEVIDALTTRQAASSLPADAETAKVLVLMNETLGANVALLGTVRAQGDGVRAEVRCIDLLNARNPGEPAEWKKGFADATERARGLIGKQIVESLRGSAEWAPPEYGDEPEPAAKEFGQPLNANGSFEEGAKGWEFLDNVATFVVPGPAGRGQVLRIRTDLERAPWVDWRRRLRFGLADPARCPTVGRDTSYNSVAGMEGVDHRSQFLPASPGQRYWLVADMKGKTAGIFFPKVFVKGYMDCSAAADALPERSLVELRMAAGDFGKLPAARQKELIESDAKKHPERYRREVFRWYLSCRNEEDQWQHYAAPCPPRGGLPANVEWLQIWIYAYWPPGDYLFDNVHLYKDPRQKAPLPEERARTPSYQPPTKPTRASRD